MSNTKILLATLCICVFTMLIIIFVIEEMGAKDYVDPSPPIIQIHGDLQNSELGQPVYLCRTVHNDADAVILVCSPE